MTIEEAIALANDPNPDLKFSLIRCHLGSTKGLDLPPGHAIVLDQNCEFCRAPITAYKATVDIVKERPELHLACGDCFNYVVAMTREPIKFGGRIENGKLPGKLLQ